jgi:hypothetical protein
MEKRHFIWAALGLLAIASCARETLDTPFEPAEESFQLTATIAVDGPETRTILLDNPGVRMQTRWAPDDAIGLFAASGEAFTLTLAGSDISEDGKTAVFRSSATIPSGTLAACYPAQSGATVSNGTIRTRFPDTQHYILARGVSQPDPAVSLMAGTGTASSGIAFSNVMAVLKIGQAFDETTIIRSVTLRDLSGGALSGSITIDPSNNYASQVSGGPAVLTLDCGEEGVTLEQGVMGLFYFIIPARQYPQGIEITFVTKEGERMSRTAGTTRGASFNRGVIYPIGDISNRDYVAGKDAAVLSDNAHMMTPELLRKMTVIEKGEDFVINEDGGTVAYNREVIKAPWFNMMVPNELGFKKGDYFVFDTSDDLPEGGVYKITAIQTPFGDENHSRIDLRMTTDFAGAYKHLNFGSKIYDAEGNSVEGGGEELDLSSYLSEIVNSDGESVPYSVSPSGQIMLSDEVVEEALTRAVIKAGTTLSTPTLKIECKSDNVEGSMGLNVSVGIRAGLSIEEGELQWVHVSLNPKVNFAASYTLTGSASKDKTVHLITLYFVPGIPIAPGVVLTPEVEIRAGIGIGGEVKFSTSVNYTYDMGTYGLTYTDGDGFRFRHEEATPAKDEGFNPEVDFSLTGTLYAKGTVTLIPTISLFRVFRAGMYVDFTLKFGLTGGVETIEKNVYQVKKMFLQPEMSFAPYVATLGGYFTKKWDDLIPSPEFDPLWERYLQPVIDKNAAISLVGNGVSQQNYRYADGSGYYFLACQEGYGDNTPIPFIGIAGHGILHQVTGVQYQAKSLKPTLDDWTVVVDVDGGEVSGLPWGNLVLHALGGISSYNYQYYNRSNVERHEVLDIPHNQGDEDDISVSGEAGVTSFRSGEIRSIHLRCINKRNNAVYEVLGGNPFTFYWPNTPDGPWFVRRSLTEYEYNHDPFYSNCHVWPSDIPLPY